VFELANRTARTRRRRIVAAFGFLCALVAAAAIALVLIRSAEQRATDQAIQTKAALEQSIKARKESDLAHLAAEKAEHEAKVAAETAAEAAEKELNATKLAQSLTVKTNKLTAENVAVKQTAAAAQVAALKATKTAAQLKAENAKRLDEQKKQHGMISNGGLN